MSAPLRAVRSAHALSGHASKAPARGLHMTGAHAQPSSIAFQSRMAEIDRKGKPSPKPAGESRPFNTHRALQKPNDSSPIDFVYFPQAEAPDPLAMNLPQVPMSPMLPDNLMPGRAQHPALASTDPITRPLIMTSDPGGLEDGRVVVMGESDTAGDAADHPDGAAGRAAQKGAGELRRVWDGFVDDLLGASKGKLA